MLLGLKQERKKNWKKYMYQIKMFLKTLFCVFLCLSEIFGKPQNIGETGKCATFKEDGYSCVEASQCSTSKCDPRLDERGGNVPDECSKDDHVEYLALECDFIPKIGFEPSICCHESAITPLLTPPSTPPPNPPPTPPPNPPPTPPPNPPPSPPGTNEQCITFEDQGYSCVKESDCRTSKCVKDIRSGIDDENQGGPSNEDCRKEKKHFEFFHLQCDITLKTTEPLVCCHKTSMTELESTKSPNEKIMEPKCGHHILKGFVPRISGSDTTTSFGEWPHMCALFQNGNFIGGATLIAPGVVVTAAHIVNKVEEKSLSVRCGDWDISNNPNKEEFFKHEELQVQFIVIHPRFESDLFLANDIALIYTSGNFTLGPIINPACLPSTPDATEVTAPCIATGWGKTSSDPKEPTPSLLKQVVLELKDKPTCEKLLADKQGKPYKLDDSAICAGGQINEDTCEGDGGGPLVCRRKIDGAENYVLVGITSWGKACGNGTVPGVYAAVGNNLCFIAAVTKCLAQEKFKDYFDYKNCDGWLSDERAKINVWIAEAEIKVSKATENFLEKKLAEKSLEKAKKSKERLEKIDNDLCGKK